MLIGLSCGLTAAAAPLAGIGFQGPPPSVSGTLPDLDLDAGTGIHTVEAAAVFGGTGLAYALATPVAGVRIDRATGTVTVDSGATGALDAQPVRIRAANGAGAATAGFTLSVGTGVDDGYVIAFDGLADGALGPTATVGTTVTVSVPGFAGPVAVRWLSDGVPVPGATAAALAVPATLDGGELSAETTPLGLAARTATAGTVRHAPPVITGALPDVVRAVATGPHTVDAAAIVSVASDPGLTAVAFALDTAPDGVAVDPSTGVITIDTDAMPPQDATPVAVRAATTGGSAATGFALSVTDGPAILVSDFDDPTDSGSFETSAPGDGTLEAAFVPAGAPAPVPAPAAAGGGWDGAPAATVSLAAPLAGETVALPYGTLDGPADLWLYQRSAAGSRSNLIRVGLTADGRAPDLALVSPAPGAGGVASDAPLVLRATEPVTAGAGSVTILADGAPVETVPAAAATIEGDTVTLPHAPFPPASAIEIRWEADLVRDLSRNPAPAGTGGAAAAFEAAAEPFAADLAGPLMFQDTGASGRLTAFVFPDVPLGAPSPGRELILLVGVFTNAGAPTEVTAVEVDGVAATGVAQVQNEVGASVWRMHRPAGTAAEVTVRVSGQGAFCAGLVPVRATGHRVVSSDIGEGVSTTGRLRLDTADGGQAYGLFMIVNGAEPTVSGGMAKALSADIRSNEWLTLAGAPTTAGSQVETLATYPAATRNVAAGIALEAD